MIVFRKIKLNESFSILGDEFGMSRSHIGNTFKEFLHPISCCMKELIVWPSPDLIKSSLPFASAANYSKVQSIVDCFKIAIEKPSNPLDQALSWSDYKGTNTIKY